MNQSIPRVFGILGAALVLGIVGDVLLQNLAWGINILVVTQMIVSAAIVLKSRDGTPFQGDGGWLAVPALLAAGGYALRDSSTLTNLDFLILGSTLLLAAAYCPAGRSVRQGVIDYVVHCIHAGVGVLFGGFRLLRDEVSWSDVSATRFPSRSVLAVGRGILFVIPLLMIFGGLLYAADPVFAHFVSLPFQWDVSAVCTRIAGIAFGTWLACGYLRHLLRVSSPNLLEQPAVSDPERKRPAIGLVETGIVLGALNALFLAFVLIQLRYFFGGRETVLATVGMTYAVYARQGFFELVMVAGLVLPLLLLLHTYQARNNAWQDRIFRVQSGMMVVLLFVIMASALGRMNLYRSEYGLTELRLYTTAFMFWLAAVFVWFCVTVLRGARSYFAVGALVAGFVGVLVLHGLNPDAKIVQTNAALARSEHRFDGCYATSLSADAVPSLISVLPSLPVPQQQIVAARLLLCWQAPKHQDWREWSWSRSQAWKAVQHNHVNLLALSKGAPANPCQERDD